MICDLSVAQMGVKVVDTHRFYGIVGCAREVVHDLFFAFLAPEVQTSFLFGRLYILERDRRSSHYYQGCAADSKRESNGLSAFFIGWLAPIQP